MVNVELLQRVRELITAEPDKHNQYLWASIPFDDVAVKPRYGQKIEVSCPTACCVAGHASLLSGDKALISSNDVLYFEGKEVYGVQYVRTPEGDDVYVEGRARDLLGLTSDQSDMLFAPTHTQAVTLEIIDALIAGDDLYSIFPDWDYDRAYNGDEPYDGHDDYDEDED